MTSSALVRFDTPARIKNQSARKSVWTATSMGVSDMRGLREIGLAPPAVLRCAQLLCRTTEDILVCQYAARTTAKPQIDGFQVRRRMSACCMLQCFFPPSRPDLHTCTALVAGCCLKRKQQRMARAAWMLVRGFRIPGVTGTRGRL